MGSRNTRWSRMSKSKIALIGVIEEYLTVCRIEGKSPATLRWYREKLSRFGRWVDDGKIEDFSIQLVRSYVEHLQGEVKYADHPKHQSGPDGISAQTIRGHVQTLKGFATWLCEEEYTTTNILERLKLPKAPKKVMQTLTDEEVARLISCIDDKTLTGSRDLSILLLFLDTGMRCAELGGLLVKDVSLEDQCMRVMGKGQKERIVPFGSRSARELIRYLNLRGQPGPNQTLFADIDGNLLSYNAIRKVFERLANKAGIPRLHVHLMRHTFATNYLRTSGNPFRLQRLLGHETLEMTRRYVDMVRFEEVTKDHQFSPVDRMKLGRRGWS